MMMVLILIYLFLIIFLALIFVVKLYAFFFTKSAGHEMAIVGEPCSVDVDAHAKIPALFRLKKNLGTWAFDLKT